MEIDELYRIFQQCQNVVIDSRKIKEGDLFFAFSGENFDAATQAEAAIKAGAIAVVVENKAYKNEAHHIFYHPSTLQILQDLARKHRSQLSIPIIGLTGSNGKTTTKELIHAVLSQKYNTQYTQGNLNNHIGVPLTLLSIKPEHEMAVVEMGANHQKEIAFLCTIAQPDYGYITNFGKAHLEGFGGIEGVIKGKSELYDYLKNQHKTVVINNQDPLQVEKNVGYPQQITFGSQQADFPLELVTRGHCVGVKFNNQPTFSQLTGAYNFNNIGAAVALGQFFQVEEAKIRTAIATYQPTNMRSQVVDRGNSLLVLDTYNANPSSMEASLQNFSLYEGSKAVVLGDMLELGKASAEEHQRILNLAKQLNFDKIITVGACFSQVNDSSLAFKDTSEVLHYLQQHPLHEKNILLKGSRGIALERLIDFL